MNGRRITALLCALFLSVALCLTASAEGVPAADPEPVPLAAGYLHSAIIREDSSLWMAGDNTYGQLGIGSPESAEEENAANEEADPGFRTSFVHVMDQVKAVYAGYSNTFAIDEEGTLYGWGWNEGGQLGLGDEENRDRPTIILPNVNTASAGYYHTAAVTSDGTLWTWGWNGNGQLGLNVQNSLATPKEALGNVRSVSVGMQHTMAVKNDNTLWATGDNTYGQLATGDTESKSSFEKVMDNVHSVACTDFGTLILKTNGVLLACGYNANGELGNGSFENVYAPEEIFDGIVYIAASSKFCSALDEAGSLYLWGDNTYGQYGSSIYITPTQLLLPNPTESPDTGDTDAEPGEGDEETDGEPSAAAVQQQRSTRVSNVAIGGGHMLYLLDDGTVYAMGNNEKGQLGTGDQYNISVPAAVMSGVSPTPHSGLSGNTWIVVLVSVLAGAALLALIVFLVLRGRKAKEAHGENSKKKAKPAKPAEPAEKPLSDRELIRLTREMASSQQREEIDVENLEDAIAGPGEEEESGEGRP